MEGLHAFDGFEEALALKRSVLMVACVALTVALLMPAIALAGNGKGPGSAPGKLKQAAGAAKADAAKGKAPGKAKGPDTDAAGSKAETKAAKSAAKAASKEAKAAQKQLKRIGAGSVETTGSDEPTGSTEPTESAEPTGAPRPGAKGLANALGRIQANIAKAEAKIAAGTKKQIPPGLLKALAKFMGWLGIVPDDPGLPDDSASDPPADPGDGSENETLTPIPSGDESGTPVYDGFPAHPAPEPLGDPAPDIP